MAAAVKKSPPPTYLLREALGTSQERSLPMPTNAKLVAICLGTVILSLLLVGVVSSTLLRHVVQVIPLVIALVAVARRSDWAGYLAIPLFLFWFLIMLAIWLFLLGVSRIVSGHYTPIEVALTVVMAVACLAGVMPAVRILPAGRRVQGVALSVAFAILQYGALWFTYLPFFPHG
jgi:hypothetical protein